ncbi:hypothetical protein BKA81DRAFT_381533 [Phyllosticta paracitricarpa]|uniref:Uncharacterized protein n=1 Tax=Phyllosticta citricarpa TaxID=55181 RepID=A0ABR1LR16_9PEZI
MWPATTAFHPTLVLLVFLQLLRLAAPRQDPPQDPYVLPCCGDIQGGDVCAVVDIVEYGKVTPLPPAHRREEEWQQVPGSELQGATEQIRGFQDFGTGQMLSFVEMGQIKLDDRRTTPLRPSATKMSFVFAPYSTCCCCVLGLKATKPCRVSHLAPLLRGVLNANSPCRQDQATMASRSDLAEPGTQGIS